MINLPSAADRRAGIDRLRWMRTGKNRRHGATAKRSSTTGSELILFIRHLLRCNQQQKTLTGNLSHQTAAPCLTENALDDELYRR
ncbi:MAG: hypothetical protein P4M00_14020 [Azospirillaceae bacterium]|nr:hypothetical protein [Azospirillaceae bacterium]